MDSSRPTTQKKKSGIRRTQRRLKSSSSRRTTTVNILVVVFTILGGLVLVSWLVTLVWFWNVTDNKKNDNNNNNDNDNHHHPDWQHQHGGGRARVVQFLEATGATIATSQIPNLPTWEQVVQLYGEHPIILSSTTRRTTHPNNNHTTNTTTGTMSSSSFEETCRWYQERVPPTRRVLGAAGMFSTGTNLLTVLLKQNCHIPERVALYGKHASRELHGIRWQVPWGKHTPAHYRERQYTTEHAQNISKHDVLPIVTIRNPLSWMQSMCKNPYTAKWIHNRRPPGHCPQLRPPPQRRRRPWEAGQQERSQRRRQQQNAAAGAEAVVAWMDDTKNDDKEDKDGDWNPVTVKYGAGTESYQSLAHLFNDWYHGYYNTKQQQHHAHYPWIMIRMEDLIFHTKETIQQVCHCAGGRLIQEETNDNNNDYNKERRQKDSFRYILDSAKADSPGHDTSTGLVEAWIKYSQSPWSTITTTWTEEDRTAAQESLDPELLQYFQYAPFV